MTSAANAFMIVASIGCCLTLVRSSTPPPRLVRSTQWNVEGGAFLGRWWGPLLVAGVIGLVVGSPVVVVSAPLVSLVVRRERRRRRDRRETLERSMSAAAFVDAAASGLRAGRSLAGAVLEEGGSLDDSSGGNELRAAVIERVNTGQSLAGAVEEVMSDDAPDERLIATTVRALDATGGSALPAIERISEALAERRSAREDARTQAQHALSSASVLASLPLVFGVLAAAVEPAIAHLYVFTWVGAVCVAVALALTIASWEWLQRLLRPAR